MIYSNKGMILLSSFIAFSLIPNLYPVLLQERNNEKTLQHQVTVTVKLIQVYVTDKNGNPVLDLGKEDFVIYEDGKKQQITEFEKHVLSLPSMEEKIQPEKIPESGLPPPRKLMNRKFFILFDFAYNNARGILKAKEAALHFIDTQLQPLDEVAVLSYSAIKSLTLHEYLTTDHKKVRNVVDSFGLKDILGRAENLEVEYWSKMQNRTPLDASNKQDPAIEGIKEKLIFDRIESLHQAVNFSKKMIEFAKALRYIPGQKHILLFSSGLPYSMMYRVNLIGSEELRSRLTYEDMLKELSASNTKIYALNTEESSILGIKLGIKIKGVFSLQNMASSTGGKYFGNINSYERHLETIQNLTGCFYVLGYYIDEKWDGKYHKIKVNVNRPGCEVHAQKGYFNPKPFIKYSELEKMLHLVDLALSERAHFQKPVHFPMVTFPCSLGKEMNLCLVSKISLEKIQDILKGKVEVISIIFDESSNIVEFARSERDISKHPENNIYYYSLFPLSPGEYKCRLVIRNLKTGRAAVAGSPAIIFERQEKGIELLSPLLLVSEKNAFYIKGFVPREKTDSFSLVDYFHFDSAQYAPLVLEELQGDSTVLAAMPYFVSNIPEPEVTISASLIEQSSGEIISLQVITRSEAKEKELSIRLIEIQIPELPSGDYALNLTAEEVKSQSASRVTKIFKIRHPMKRTFN